MIGAIIGGIGLVLGLFYFLSNQRSGEIRRVRTAVLAAAPELNCSIGSYSGNGSGLHAAINNNGQVRAHDLALSFPTMGVVWQQLYLERGDWARPQIPIPDNAALRTRNLDDPSATLTYKDRFGLLYTMGITLTQARRDDGRFNLGSTNVSNVERPKLSSRVLWKLRRQV